MKPMTTLAELQAEADRLTSVYSGKRVEVQISENRRVILTVRAIGVGRSVGDWKGLVAFCSGYVECRGEFERKVGVYGDLAMQRAIYRKLVGMVEPRQKGKPFFTDKGLDDVISVY